MGTAGHAVDPLDDAAHYGWLLATARDQGEVMAAVREYLAAWPKARVASLQRTDGGWAPFDELQQPIPLYRPADVKKIHDAVHGQCASLRGAGILPARELLELDVFFFLASEKLVQTGAGFMTARSGAVEGESGPRAHR
jgi:hypothetical protein